MPILSDDRLNMNFIAYTKRLEKYRCYSDTMISELGERLKRCPFSVSESGGGSYDGGMIEVVLKILCNIAYRINELGFGDDGKGKTAFPLLKVNNDMLMRVLLLQHISKAEMFIYQPDNWKRKNGRFYEFNDDLQANLRTGERSLYLCQRYGINLTEEEYEAIRIIDRPDEQKGDAFMSPLCMLSKMANQLTALELRQRYEKELREKQ